MYTKMITIEELANNGMFSSNTKMILKNANVHTLADLDYGNPYNLGWLQLPGMNWDVYEEIIGLFIRLDTKKALADPLLKALQYKNLPKRFQYELEVNYDVTFDANDVTTYVEKHGMSVETLHNAAINSPYAIMRLIKDFDFAENALMRRYIRDYLKGEIYAIRNDCYAQVRDLYAMRQNLIPQQYMKLFPEEIAAFFLNGKVRNMVYEQFPYFVKVMDDEPTCKEIQNKYIKTPKDLLLLFQKPQETFLRLVGNQYDQDTIDQLMSIVFELSIELSDQIKKWLNEGDDYDMY